MNPDRIQRSQLHSQVGIFRYSQILDRAGVDGAARQIWTLGQFVEHKLGTAPHLPPANDEEQILSWVETGLIETADEIDWSAVVTDVPTLATLALRVQRHVAWDVYRDFAELLNFRCGAEAYAASGRRLRQQNLPGNLEDVWSYAERFLVEYLPRAVRSFRLEKGDTREVPWLASVFYRFALRIALTDLDIRRELETFVATGVTKSSYLVPDSEYEALAAAIPRALEQLPNQERSALGLYFGFGAREHTLEEIGEALEISEYLARRAVVRGLAVVASRLGIQGVLSDEEFTLANKVFGEGLPLTVAASTLGISKRKARSLAKGVGEKLRRGLRARTVPVQAPTYQQIEEIIPMKPLPEPDQIIAELDALTATPRLEVDRFGVCYAELSLGRLPLEFVRRVAFDAQSQHRLSLDERLSWLAQPDVTLGRADLDPEEFEWDERLVKLECRPWSVAQWLDAACMDQIKAERMPLPTIDAEARVEALYWAVVGVGAALESLLPSQLRRQRTAVFRIEPPSNGVTFGRWEEESQKQRFDVAEIISEVVCELEDLPEYYVELVPLQMLGGLRDGLVHLPRFRETESADGTVWLRWLPPTTDARLAALEEESAKG